MRRSRVVLRVGAALLCAAIIPLFSPTGAGARLRPPDPDGPAVNPPVSKVPGEIDLADVAADRWIVQLDDPAVATRARALGTDVTTEESRTYRDSLAVQQYSFGPQLAAAAPGAHVERDYQLVLNGLAVDMTRDARGRRPRVARRARGNA